MTTPDHVAVPAVSRRWWLTAEPRWQRLRRVAEVFDVPLLALIGQRYEAFRNEIAREAFETQRDFCVVAWEWREELRLQTTQQSHGHVTPRGLRTSERTEQTWATVCRMTCSACPAELWRQTRAETDAVAEAAGWRHHLDGKTPQLSAGAALCPADAGKAADFQPAPKRGAK